MRAFGLHSIIAAFVLASPVISTVLLPRKQVCANDGKTVAGTIFTRDLSETSSSLRVRGNSPIPCIWCGISTTTYIVITSLAIPGLLPDDTRPLLQRRGVAAAAAQLKYYIGINGDVALPAGSFTYLNDWVRLQAFNANNHQLTRGVTLSAFLALRSWMIAYGVFGTASFKIYDGFNLVGSGNLELLNGLPN
ncbi:MAG: hypothetical protein FRX48_04272 [Lasallia pustulata]|uniref:Uncharacterized protein n=1 Tax=Lasallia pustulata TaxID=136370 RepID=A0A5M8PT10_9LECA|nr:MAG: hypothetical protein FRX48_04272 [Lasallia pustulata]